MEIKALNAFRDIQIKSTNDESKTLHSYIVNGDVENVKAFLIPKTHSRPYLNEKGKSAAFVAIQHRQFKIYSLLLSHDIRFVSDDERRILKELTLDEHSEFNKELVRNSNEIKDAAVNFLLSNTKFVNNKNSGNIIDIKKCYEELNEIPEIGLVFSVVKCSGFVNIIFDFEMDSIIDIDPTASKYTRGVCHPEDGRIYIGAKRDDENALKGTIAHELTHYAMQIVYSNNCQPYHFTEADKQVKFHVITSETNKLIVTNRSGIGFDGIIRLVFECYDESDWSRELVVRVNHMLAFHGLEKGEKILIEQAGELLRFYRDDVMSHCKHFIEESYFFKPKSEIEIFNLSSGLLARVKNSGIAFVQSFKSEFEVFIKSEGNSFLLISTASSVLSVIKVVQSLNHLPLNLSQYVITDCDTYCKQLNAVDKLLSCNSCQLLVVNMSQSKETSLQQILTQTSDILQTKPNFKIIFIIDGCKAMSLLLQMNDHKHKLMIDNRLGFKDLTKKSQENILLKEIRFQGEKVLLKALITTDNKHLIDTNALTKFVSNEKVRIGSGIVVKNFHSNTYISRELNQIITTDNYDYEMSEQLELRESLASTKYQNNMKSLNEHEMIEQIANEKVIVIADIAGSGKSTLLTHIAILIKQQFKQLWIVRVNLNSFTQTFKNKLNSNNQFNVDEAVEFLLESQQMLNNDAENAHFSRNIFKSSLDKVVVMFDGFDEINPDYATTVQSLVKATMEANVKQIWVTTRPQCKAMIKRQLQCNSFEIKPLNKEIQLEYLFTFWETNLNIEISDCEYAALVRRVKNSIAIGKNSILENPLQLMMFAEASIDQCKEFLFSSKQVLIDREFTFKIADLYEKFISKKLDVYQDEKLELDSSKVGANKFFSKEKLEEIHQVAALKLFFSQNEIGVLLCGSHIKQDTDFDHIEVYGIIRNFTYEQPEFVHLTFAEYFVARFLAKITLQHQITKEIAEIILKTVLMKTNFKMIRSFLNGILMEITTEMTRKLEEFVCVWEESFINKRETPISVALDERRHKIIELLCACFNKTKFMTEMTIRNPISSDTLLHLAVIKSNKPLIKMLIDDYNIDVNVINEAGERPLHLASGFSSTEIIQMLINDYKADVTIVDNNGLSLLHWATLLNRTIVIRMLIEDYKAKVNVLNIKGETPLHWAAKNNSYEVIKMLIDDYGANVNAVDNVGCTPLHFAIKYNNKVLKMLIDCHGAKVSAVDNIGSTLLHWAVLYNRSEFIEMLIADFKADVNAVDRNGSTSLHWAVLYNRIELIDMLIVGFKAGVDAVDNNGNTPLHWAAYKNSQEVVKMLIDDYGANVNAANNKGSTLLHVASIYNSKDVAELLIENYGANVNVVDNEGKTPFDWAVEFKSKEVIKILTDYNGH